MFSSTPTSPITTSAITKQLCLPKHKTRHCVSCPLPSPLSPCPTVNRKMSAAAPRCVCWVGGGVTGYTHESPINCISYLCHCYDQTADRYNLRLFFSDPQFEGTVSHMRESTEYKAVSRVALVIRNQREMDAGAHSILFSSEPQPMG